MPPQEAKDILNRNVKQKCSPDEEWLIDSRIGEKLEQAPPHPPELLSKEKK